MPAMRKLLVLVLLAGCATNATRLGRGKALGVAGAGAATATAGFIDRVRVARENANIALVASSPTCAWGDRIILRGDDPRGTDGTLTCRPRGQAANPAAGDQVVSLRPIPPQALRPTTDTLAALVAYLDAVNAVMAGESPDVASKVGDALGYAIKAQAGLNAVLKAHLAVIPALTDAQQAAITDLAKLVNELAAERHKARQLENLVARQNAVVRPLIDSLDRQVALWGAASLEGDVQLADASLTAAARQLGDGQPADLASRAALIRMIIEGRRTTAAVPAVIAEVHNSLKEMADAQDTLVAAYTANPGWTKAERARQAQLNRKRLLGALEAIAAVAGAAL